MAVCNACCAKAGLLGSVPLPPLKGVRDVRKSKPLLKSKYSLKALTLIWAETAPTSTKMKWMVRICPDDQMAVPSPNKTHAGVSIKKGTRMGPNTYFR